MRDYDIRVKLAYAYRILSHLGMDDWTYTHLSARAHNPEHFFILPFGLLFEEITPENLLKLDLDGNIIEGDCKYNKTGYHIHGTVYQHRQDVNAIFHLHTVAGVAVSMLECGLMPISQFALHFWDNIAYHSYNGLNLQAEKGTALIKDLGDKNLLFLRNHGTLVAASAIEEAFFYTIHLENSCKTQLLATQTGQKVLAIKNTICSSSNKDLMDFEQHLGQRDWAAAVRLIQRVNPFNF